MAKAKKVAPKKAAPKKAIAKKVVKAAPAKKVVAKKVAKPAAKKVVAKKVIKAAPAKKVVAKKVAKPAAKKVVAKKVVKAAPVKKAVAKKIATPAPKKAVVAKPTKATPVAKVGNQGSSSITKQRQGNITVAKTQEVKLTAKEKKKLEQQEQMYEATQKPPKGMLLTETHYVSPEPQKPKANVRYSDKELKEFEGVISREREKSIEELRMLRERLDDLTSYESSNETAVYSMHMADLGSEAIERDKTYAHIQRTNDYIRKLDEAQKRIEEKSYGICRQCGILIAKERLMAVPITTLSASWKLRGVCPADGIDKVGK